MWLTRRTKLEVHYQPAPSSNPIQGTFGYISTSDELSLPRFKVRANVRFGHHFSVLVAVAER